MILTHLVLFGFWTGAGAPTVTPIPEVQQGGGAVIVDIPRKKRGRKSKNDEVIDQPIEPARVISDEEAQGMAAIYGIPEKVEPIPSELPENQAEIEPADGLNLFQIPDSVYGVEPPEVPAEAEEIGLGEQAQEVEEVDDIALILAIIEAIG